MGVVLAVEAKFRVAVRLLLIAVMLGGIAVSLSRLGLACAALGLLLSVVFPPSQRAREMRRGLVVTMVVGALVLVPFTVQILARAGSEASGSAAYRGNLLNLLPYVDLFGTTSEAYTAPDGTRYIGPFRSIDSQLLLFGLTYGWLVLGSAILLLLIAVIAMWRRSGGVATIAVVAQIPALATVALITQYAVFFWFVAGLAASSGVVSGRGRATSDGQLDEEVYFGKRVL